MGGLHPKITPHLFETWKAWLPCGWRDPWVHANPALALLLCWFVPLPPDAGEIGGGVFEGGRGGPWACLFFFSLSLAFSSNHSRVGRSVCQRRSVHDSETHEDHFDHDCPITIYFQIQVTQGRCLIGMYAAVRPGDFDYGTMYPLRSLTEAQP